MSIVTGFKVIGERCSGTNFVSALIEQNFYLEARNGVFGHKHWAKVPKKNNQTYDNILFVFIVRNVFDWIDSFSKTHYHVPFMYASSIQQFVTHSPWMSDREDVNPETNRRFLHLVHMRSKKHECWIRASPFVKNVVWVRYEDLLLDPVCFLEHLSQQFHLPSKNVLFNVLTNVKVRPDSSTEPFDSSNQKEKQMFYDPQKVHSQIPQEVLKFVYENLDFNVESALGYECFLTSVFGSDFVCERKTRRMDNVPNAKLYCKNDVIVFGLHDSDKIEKTELLLKTKTYSVEEASVIVTKLYNECLGRNPDPEGFSNYTTKIQSGEMDEDDLRNILIESEEYNRLHPFFEES